MNLNMNKLSISYSSIRDWRTQTKEEWYRKWILKDFPKVENKAYNIGTIIDALLYNREDLLQTFYFTDALIPTDKAMPVIKEYIQSLKKLLLPSEFLDKDTILKTLTVAQITEGIENILKKHNFKNNRKDKNKISTDIWNNYKDYIIDSLLTTLPIVSNKELEKCCRLKDIILNDPKSAKYFQNNEEYTNVIQEKLSSILFVNNFEVTLKGVLDSLFIDEKEQTITIIDLKSTSNAKNFHKSVIDYDYNYQMSIYAFLVETSWYAEYIQMRPVNVIIDKVYERISYHQYDYELLKAYQVGNKQNDIKGWREYIDEITKFLNDYKPSETIN